MWFEHSGLIRAATVVRDTRRAGWKAPATERVRGVCVDRGRTRLRPYLGIEEPSR